MSDNTTLNAGSGGEDLASAEVTFSGDTTSVQICGGGIVTGSAESYAVSLIVGGAGAVAAGVQRVTLASDDPAVALLTTIDADTGAIKTAVEVVDDWDESDRAKVNIIAGQAGIAANAGAVGATVPRVTLASDDPGVAHLATIAGDTTAIETAVELLDNAVDGNYLNVNVNAAGTDLTMNAGVLTAQTQRVTIATDDEVNNLLGTIDADTGAIKTAVEALDNAVDGNYLNVNLNLAGTDADAGEGVFSANTIRVTQATDDDGVAHLSTIATKTTSMEAWDDGSDHCEVILVANTGVDIGDVDVTSIVSGTGATNLGKARASALGATDTGVAALAVRNDDLADLAGADGDYTPLQVDPRGALYVNSAAAEDKVLSGVAAGGAPGADVMIAAVAGKKLKIVALQLLATSTTTNTVYIDNVDNDLLGNSGNGIPLSLDADGDTIPGFNMPYNPGGWFKTDAVNEAVTLNTSAAQDIIWCVTFIETD